MQAQPLVLEEVSEHCSTSLRGRRQLPHAGTGDLKRTHPQCMSTGGARAPRCPHKQSVEDCAREHEVHQVERIENGTVVHYIHIRQAN